MSAFFEQVRNSTTGALDKARLTFQRDSGDDSESGVEEEPDTSWTEELSNYCPTLTFQQRLIGFFSSFGLGYLIAFFSFRFFIRLVEGNPLPFAINYTFGHILQLLASMFLCGPRRQFRNMFDEKRYLTSVTYLSCLGATLVIIFIPMPGMLKFLLILGLTMAQFCASTWYSLSYIPYGRRTALRFLKRAMSIEDSTNYAGIQT
uniref:Vesicle transport protein n=2 Tax=Amphora coffeiformis TaxID=265554 RepID=A0A7S3P7U2_9STRA|mmetsp:Transcript_13376/g.25400  ORF Transcript_13376/g.25400 Transcript_13376/m.25400 type:complete len:204 (+) Transcript_13376:108-719(+)